MQGISCYSIITDLLEKWFMIKMMQGALATGNMQNNFLHLQDQPGIGQLTTDPLRAMKTFGVEC